MNNKKVKIVNTNQDNKDGALICPSCSSSDVTYDIKKKVLKCNYCSFTFDEKPNSELIKSIEQENGEIRGSGIIDIKKNPKKVSLICSGCGSKVIINTEETLNQRCHWCHSILSVNKQREDGIIPDEILPFSIEKEEAIRKIEKFIQKKKIFGNNKFYKEYNKEKIIGVYLPYVLYDASGHAKLKGEGEKFFYPFRRILQTIFSKNENIYKDSKVYDAKVYKISRDFDFTLNQLSTESNKEYQNNNIINSIMPFDTENCVQYNSNYLYGYRYVIRNINIEELKKKAAKQVRGIIRYSMHPYIKKYNRGVHWKEENIKINSERWTTVYLPVWLYSYKEKDEIDYIIVNGRTGEINGKVPLNKLVNDLSAIVLYSFEIVLIIIIIIFWINNPYNKIFVVATVLIGIIMVLTLFFPRILKLIYHRTKSRHFYEKETKHSIKNIIQEDLYMKKRYNLKNRKIEGCNDSKLLD